MTSSYQCVNPNTGKLLKSFEHLTAPQLEKSLAAAEKIVNKAAALMHAHVDDFAPARPQWAWRPQMNAFRTVVTARDPTQLEGYGATDQVLWC